MKLRKTGITFAAIALLLGGCVSTTPRPYTPVVQPPAENQAAFERDFAIRSTAVARGERNFGHSTGAVVVGTVGGAAGVHILGGVAAAASVGGSGVLGATGVGLLLLVPVATYNLSKSRRDRNEREIQTAMTACLAQRGYSVVSWTRTSPENAASLANVTPTHQIGASAQQTSSDQSSAPSSNGDAQRP